MPQAPDPSRLLNASNFQPKILSTLRHPDAKLNLNMSLVPVASQTHFSVDTAQDIDRLLPVHTVCTLLACSIPSHNTQVSGKLWMIAILQIERHIANTLLIGLVDHKLQAW